MNKLTSIFVLLFAVQLSSFAMAQTPQNTASPDPAHAAAVPTDAKTTAKADAKMKKKAKLRKAEKRMESEKEQDRKTE